MTTRHEGHGNLAKQFLKVASMAGMMKLSHLHSQQAYSSGENLSPRSVLEQTALSGLAIAIDLEEKEKVMHTQENVIVGRVFWKQNIQQNPSMGRSVYRERMDDNVNQEERETVGLRVVGSLNQMNSQEAKGHENLIMGRSVSRERMREMVQMTYGGRESERKEDILCTSHMKGSLSSSPSFPNVGKLLPKSLPEREESRGWLHLHGHEAQSFPACSSSMENSIFYCASSPPNTSRNVIDNDDDHTCSPVEDFLQLCFFCKCHLRAGKDIFMYRGDQAFCSAECRYQQIMNDECMGSSAP